MGAREPDQRVALHTFGRGAFALAAAASFGAFMLVSPSTRATHVDPAEPATIVVGPSPGVAPMARVDGARRGRAHQPLPAHPKIVWRRIVRGGLEFAPLAVDERGAILVPSATLPEVVQISADGRESWRASTRRGPSITSAAILGNGTRILVTSAGELLGFSPDGELRFVTPLELQERNARIGLLPLEDGGAAIASGNEVHEIDADGSTRRRTRLAERIMGPLVGTRAGPVATTTSGSAYLLKPGYVQRLGSFGGEPSESGASSPDGRTLWAIVDHQRVVALDPTNGATQVRFAVTDQSLHGPVVFGRRDSLVFTTWMGLLITLAANGELWRTSLEPRLSTLVTDAGKVDFAALDESPPPVTDAEGRTGFARVGDRVGVVQPDGSVRLVSEPTCGSPAALAPAGERRMVIGCRDGTVLLLGDEGP
jgi:hypothetical protein